MQNHQAYINILVSVILVVVSGVIGYWYWAEGQRNLEYNNSPTPTVMVPTIVGSTISPTMVYPTPEITSADTSDWQTISIRPDNRYEIKYPPLLIVSKTNSELNPQGNIVLEAEKIRLTLLLYPNEGGDKFNNFYNTMTNSEPMIENEANGGVLYREDISTQKSQAALFSYRHKNQGDLVPDSIHTLGFKNEGSDIILIHGMFEDINLNTNPLDEVIMNMIATVESVDK